MGVKYHKGEKVAGAQLIGRWECMDCGQMWVDGQATLHKESCPNAVGSGRVVLESGEEAYRVRFTLPLTTFADVEHEGKRTSLPVTREKGMLE